MLELPYYANCKIAGEDHFKLPIVKMNPHSVLVKLPDGEVIKRSFRKHNIEVVYVSPLL